MNVQEFIAYETHRAMEALVRQARRVPADKLTWQPQGEGRSVLSQVAECAVLPGYLPHILETFEPPAFDDASMTKYRAAVAAVTSLDYAEKILRENTAHAIAAIKAVPDSKLESDMPFFGPDPWKVHSVMNSHAWNMHYHTGQICFIQTLLGDHDM